MMQGDDGAGHGERERKRERNEVRMRMRMRAERQLSRQLRMQPMAHGGVAWPGPRESLKDRIVDRAERLPDGLRGDFSRPRKGDKTHLG